MGGIYLSSPGVICAAGNNSKELWSSCVHSNCDGIKKTKVFDKEFFIGKVDDSFLESVPTARYDMRIIRILNKALLQIDSLVKKAIDLYGSDRICVCLGACDNGSEFSRKAHEQFFNSGSFSKDYKIDEQSADYPAAFIKEALGIKGPSFVFATACSSSATAIVKAQEMILAGIVDAAIVGGVDIASETALVGFDSLEAISNKRTNPFSKNRSGITLGEGACLFVMARDKSLVQDEGFCVELLGCGESSDAHHMTSPLEDGSGAKRAIIEALKDSRLNAFQIDYLNLHGTGTHLNDAMESKAVKSVFGDYTTELPVSSTKPLTGHTLGASGAIELAICYLALKNAKEKKLPVQVWDGEFDEELPKLNFVSKEFTCKKEIQIAMSNSFGFGGCNVSLIIKTVNNIEEKIKE